MPAGSLDMDGTTETLRVLVVEDETADAKFTLDALESTSEDVTVEVTPYGERGLELLADRSFDVVLLDHRLPRMNGVAFVREMRRRDQQLPVIVITGRGSDEVQEQLRQAGADAYLDKDDVDGPTLSATIGTVLADPSG